MGLDSLVEAVSIIGNALASAKGLGSILVLAGFSLILALIVGFGGWLLIRLVKKIPRMTPIEFLKFVIFFSLGLIVVGILLP